MWRHLAYGLLVAGFAVLAWHGIDGWANPPARRPHATGSFDAVPFAVGEFNDSHVRMMQAKQGYPWKERAETLASLKRDLPPDPAVPTAEETRKAIEEELVPFKLPLPEGRLTWPQIVGRLRTGLAPIGVKVTTGEPSPPASFVLDVPPNDWPVNTSLKHIHDASQKLIGYQVSSEGIAIGTDAAVNRLMLDARLTEVRRRVAAEHADAKLNAEFTPDFADATVVGFSRFVEGQTGIEVVFDPAVWEMIQAMRWRGQPRRLRDALDELTQHPKMRLFWRWHDGRVWVMKP